MSLTHEKVKNLFNHLKTGQNELFFQQVAPDVKWTVMGNHPLAGTYHSKDDFILHTFGRLNKILKEGVILEVKNIYIDVDVAIVEMESLSTALNGKPFNNTYCWITRFENDIIVEVRAYVDSALVQKVIDENENI
ncbi:MAG: ketosteroid isomerase [Methanobacteriaceae archaeon]|jgi:ketosteroid isomerase-like protein|nr:ketosteroid isomerase [Methanobacteriaceae archaeon]MDO9627667.1 ketosteroid isomerase [Methanobacteriaceae archaeon]